MAAGIDAVVAALRVALEEAERSDEAHWNSDAANRWIALLPGASLGRWRHLKLSQSSVSRETFVGHVRATVAYLEASHSEARPRRRWWQPRRRAAASPPAQQIAPSPAPTTRPVNLLRVRRPMPGVH